MIIAIGYRVKSNQGTQFIIWANAILKEYLVKGYNINVERFKNNGNDPYFEELLDKIRDIRSSEKVFGEKYLIYIQQDLHKIQDIKVKDLLYFKGKVSNRHEVWEIISFLFV